jgi:hypothetical protein
MSRVSEYDEKGRFFAFLAAAHAANVGSEWNNELAAPIPGLIYQLM